MKQSSIITGTLRSLFRSWAISMGFIAVILAFSHYINKSVLPCLLLLLAFVITGIMRSRRMSPKQTCLRMGWTVRTTLVLSAIVMYAVLLLHNKHLFGDTFNGPGFNPRIPYITGIVVFSCGALVSLYAMFMGDALGVCRVCRKMYGEYDGDSLASSLFSDESEHQLQLFFWICFGVGGAQWFYFYLFFINVNFNSPDLFFFNYMPVAVYVLSLVFVGMRYFNISETYKATATAGARLNRGTTLRYLVTCGDSMLLREQGEGEWDTPYKAEVSENKVSEERARNRFESMGGPADATLRFLYSNVGVGGDNTSHYAAFVPEESRQRATRGGQWLTLYDIDQLLHSGRIAPVLANELVRIHTITMAWKTYDREGKRLYPIKHYRPLFRLRDFKDWDVDYNDPLWLRISSENEDKRFFRARRIWRKCLDVFGR
ncbi:MAG: hypothetical protein K2G07_08295 [Muribaculaceae bacterium]|nr:hypothetical protein [Muribaculaceae bacterium]